MSEGKDEKEIIIKDMAKWNGAYSADILRDGDPKWQKDEEVVTEAVKHNGLALMYASEELKSNPDIILEAVEQNGWAVMDANLRNLENRVNIIIAAYNNVCNQESDFKIKGMVNSFINDMYRRGVITREEFENKIKPQLKKLTKKAEGKKKKKGTKKKKSPKKRKGTKKKTPPKKKKAPKKKKSSRKRKGSTNGRR